MIPPEFREVAACLGSEGELMLASFDKCVAVYPLPEWEHIEESFSRVNVLDKRLRNLQRFFLSSATRVGVDKQGRVLIPPHLRQYANLEKEVVVAGVGRKFEIWNKDGFEAKRLEVEEVLDDDMADLAESGIELRI